jgi:aspartate aminotransferase
MLAPAGGFYITEGLGKQEVRLAYVLEQADLEKAMQIIKAALEVYPGRTDITEKTKKETSTL